MSDTHYIWCVSHLSKLQCRSKAKQPFDLNYYYITRELASHCPIFSLPSQPPSYLFAKAVSHVVRT